MGIFDMFKSCNEITQKVKCSNKNKLVNQLDIYIKRNFKLIESIYFNKKKENYIQLVKIDLDRFDTNILGIEVKESKQWGGINCDYVFGNMVNGKRQGFWYFVSNEKIWRIDKYQDDKLNGETIIIHDGIITNKDLYDDYHTGLDWFNRRLIHKKIYYNNGELYSYTNFKMWSDVHKKVGTSEISIDDYKNSLFDIEKKFFKNGNICYDGKYKGNHYRELKKESIPKYNNNDFYYKSILTKTTHLIDIDDEDLTDLFGIVKYGEWIFYNKEGLIVGKGTYDEKGVEKDGIFVEYQRNSTIDDTEIEKVKIYKDGYLIETKEY